jgi:hypothetical protein
MDGIRYPSSVVLGALNSSLYCVFLSCRREGREHMEHAGQRIGMLGNDGTVSHPVSAFEKVSS